MLSKHLIYFLEAINAMIATLESVKDYHERITNGAGFPSLATRETQESFRYRGTMFKSTKLRLESLEKRILNIINLVCSY